ncbi:hypothetical protein QZH41_009939 [Actinostola sp. cb2023]|nr:hypothetical protein QZH41_009939 [Actinostola sp. cb2023]
MDSDEGYLSELLAEKDSLDPSFVHCMRLLTREINRVQAAGSPVTSIKADEEENMNGSQTNESGDVTVQDTPPLTRGHIDRREHREPLPFRRHHPTEENKLYQPVKLSEKVYIPSKEHPKFNFVGKLLGPRGNTFKRLQSSTGTKMSILGKGSMRDKEKEDELKGKGEAKYEHLSDDLHVLIEVEAPPGQAHARLGIAIEEIKKYLNPVRTMSITHFQAHHKHAKRPVPKNLLKSLILPLTMAVATAETCLANSKTLFLSLLLLFNSENTTDFIIESQNTNDEIHQEQMREMAILNSLEDGSPAPAPGGSEQSPPTFARGRGRARVATIHPHQGSGRGVHIARQGHPVTLRRVQQGHQTISIAARSAAGLPSPSIAHPTRVQPPGPIDPFGGVHAVLIPNELHQAEHVQLHDTYDPAYGYEATYAEPEEGTYYEYGRGVAPAEIYETAYPAPGRLPASMAANYKSTSHRPTKKIIREATYPY